ENFGAESAIDLLRVLKQISKTDPTKDFTTLVIQIASDPDMVVNDEPKRDQCDASIGDTPLKTVEGWFARTRARFAGEIRAPIGGLLKTREARGSLAMRRLACEADKYFLFRMKPQPWDSSGLARTLRTCLLSWAMAP